MKKLIASVNPKILKALLITAAKNDVRFYLNGVALQMDKGGKTRFAATHGHCLSVYGNVRMEVASTLIIPYELVKLASIAFNSVDLVDISVQDEYVIISSNFHSQQLYDKFLEGQYPDINRVIPNHFEDCEKCLGDFNLKYIADAIRIGQTVSANSKPIMQARDKHSSAVITYLGVPDLSCIIMPMRGISGFFAEDGEWKPS